VSYYWIVLFHRYPHDSTNNDLLKSSTPIGREDKSLLVSLIHRTPHRPVLPRLHRLVHPTLSGCALKRLVGSVDGGKRA
jgi:hypothetical protein